MPHIALLMNLRCKGSAEQKAISELLQQEEYAAFSLIPLYFSELKKTMLDLVEKGYTIFVACGGDGTLSSVVQVILEESLPVKCAVLPLGTFNHFAKDIGMPLTIKEGLDIILQGKSAHLDVGKVNDTYFINNSSVGLYPKLVAHREEFQKKGWHKAVALYLAFFAALRSHSHITVEFDAESGTKQRETLFVFVGNNKYELGGLDMGKRKHLDEGVLSLSLTEKISARRFILFCIHALKGTLVEQKDFNTIGLQKCTLRMKKKHVSVSHDGETSKMRTPLHYTIVPKALLFVIP
jgi:diacylglycerol kinase family enzyme